MSLGGMKAPNYLTGVWKEGNFCVFSRVASLLNILSDTVKYYGTVP